VGAKAAELGVVGTHGAESRSGNGISFVLTRLFMLLLVAQKLGELFRAPVRVGKWEASRYTPRRDEALADKRGAAPKNTSLWSNYRSGGRRAL
jgi:hypothetical protein